MEVFIDVFRNRPGKSIGTVAVLVISLITIIMFQEIQVETLSEVINYFSKSADNTPLVMTWGFNLFSFSFLLMMGIFWIKDIFQDNFFDISPDLGRVICLIIGMLLVLYSTLFFKYIFSDLLGVVIAVLLIFAIINGSKR